MQISQNKKTFQPSIKKNLIINTLYQILSVLTPFITAPYAARVLGADALGAYSFTNSFQIYFSLFAALGIASYGNREIARKRDDCVERSKTFWEIQIIKFCASLISLIGWGGFILLNTSYRNIYIVLTMSIMATMFDITWFYTGLEQFKYTVIRNTIVRLLEVVLLFILVKTKDDLIIYIALMSSATLLGAISMWFSLPKFLVKVSVKDFTYKHHLKETVIYFIPTIATSLYTVLDKTLIGVITHNESQNGYYEEANKVLGIVKTLVYTSLNSVLGSRISYLFEEEKYEEIKQRIEISMHFIFFMGLGCCFGIIAVAKLFVPLFFGPGFEPVVFLLQLLSPVVLIIGISNCLGSQYYTPAGYRGRSSIYIIIGSIVNIILNIILIPKLESIGAAIGTIIAETIITILYIFNCNKYFTISQLIKCSWKKIIAAISMFCVINIISYIHINAFLLLIIEIIIGILVYCVMLLLLNDFFIKEIILKKIITKYNNIRKKD